VNQITPALLLFVVIHSKPGRKAAPAKKYANMNRSGQTVDAVGNSSRHVACMLHGAAEVLWGPLELLENIWCNTRHARCDQINLNSLILFAVQRRAPHELAGCPPQW
jgi:hypothetical protein